MAAVFPVVMYFYLVAFPMIMIVVISVCRCNGAEGDDGGCQGENDSFHERSSTIRVGL